MANQDVVLQLKAQLDSSGIETQAASMASQMASAMEQAFNQVGDKIAASIQRAVQQGLGSAFSGGQQAFQAQVSGPAVPPAPGQSPIMQPGGGYFQSVLNPVYAGAQPPPPNSAMLGRSPHSPNSSESDQAKYQAGAAFSKFDPFSNPMLSGLSGQSISGSPEFTGFSRVDETVRMARMMSQARKAGVNLPMTEDINDQMKSARDTLRTGIQSDVERLKDNTSAMKSLEEKIIELTQKVAAGNEEARKQLADEQVNLEGRKRQAAEIVASQTGKVQGLGYVDELTSGGAGTRIRTVGGIAAAGALMSLAGEIPAGLRGAEAAQAGMSSLMGRAALGGDIDRMIAMQRMGGREGLEGGARIEEWLKAGGQTITSAAMGVGAAMSGGTLAPILGTGAVAMGAGAINRFVNMDRATLQNIQNKVSATMERDQEYYATLNAGRAGAVEAFRTAQAMGAPEMSGFLTGMSGSKEFDLSIGRDEAKLAEIRRERSNYLAWRNPEAPGAKQHLAEMADKESKLQRSIEMAQYQKESFGTGKSLLEIGQDLGFRPEQTQDTLRRMAQAGGVGSGNEMQGPRMRGAAATLLELQSVGLSSAAEAYGGLVQGGMERGAAPERLKEIFEEAVSAGMDRTKVAGYMQTMAQQAATSPYGAGWATQNMERGLAATQNMYGEKPTIGQVDYMMRAQQGISAFTTAGGGAGMVAGFMGADMLAAELAKEGINVDAADRMLMQQYGGKIGPGGIEKLEKKYGKTLSTGARNRLAEFSSTAQAKGAKQLAAAYGPGGEAIMSAQIVGATDFESAYEAPDIISSYAKGGTVARTKTLEDLGKEREGAVGIKEAKALADVDYTRIVTGFSQLGPGLEELVAAVNQAKRDIGIAVTGSRQSNKMVDESIPKAPNPYTSANPNGD